MNLPDPPEAQDLRSYEVEEENLSSSGDSRVEEQLLQSATQQSGAARSVLQLLGDSDLNRFVSRSLQPKFMDGIGRHTTATLVFQTSTCLPASGESGWRLPFPSAQECADISARRFSAARFQSSDFQTSSLKQSSASRVPDEVSRSLTRKVLRLSLSCKQDSTL